MLWKRNISFFQCLWNLYLTLEEEQGQKSELSFKDIPHCLFTIFVSEVTHSELN